MRVRKREVCMPFPVHMHAHMTYNIVSVHGLQGTGERRQPPFQKQKKRDQKWRSLNHSIVSYFTCVVFVLCFLVFCCVVLSCLVLCCVVLSSSLSSLSWLVLCSGRLALKSSWAYLQCKWMIPKWDTSSLTCLTSYFVPAWFAERRLSPWTNWDSP